MLASRNQSTTIWTTRYKHLKTLSICLCHSAFNIRNPRNGSWGTNSLLMLSFLESHRPIFITFSSNIFFTFSISNNISPIDSDSRLLHHKLITIGEDLPEKIPFNILYMWMLPHIWSLSGLWRVSNVVLFRFLVWPCVVLWKKQNLISWRRTTLQCRSLKNWNQCFRFVSELRRSGFKVPTDWFHNSSSFA